MLKVLNPKQPTMFPLGLDVSVAFQPFLFRENRRPGTDRWVDEVQQLMQPPPQEGLIKSGSVVVTLWLLPR